MYFYACFLGGQCVSALLQQLEYCCARWQVLASGAFVQHPSGQGPSISQFWDGEGAHLGECGVSPLGPWMRCNPLQGKPKGQLMAMLGGNPLPSLFVPQVPDHHPLC
mgnify:CR=1 FL=1